jgi:protein involved in ribonucleotide reduction
MDKTIRIFDSFYSFNANVNPDEYDIVHGYFMSVCANKNIANNFTATIFRISQTTGVPALTLLEYIRGENNSDTAHMDKTICYFLNTMKSKTAMYGVSQLPKPNQPVSRNILQ